MCDVADVTSVERNFEALSGSTVHGYWWCGDRNDTESSTLLEGPDYVWTSCIACNSNVSGTMLTMVLAC